MSSAALALPCPPRFATQRTPSRATHGEKSALVAEFIGRPYTPHQRYIVDVAGEIDPSTGLLAYRVVIIVLPRQQGKTAMVPPIVTERMMGAYGGGKQTGVYTAQRFLDAKKKWLEDQVPLIEGSPLGRLVSKKLSAGDEHMRWPNRSRYGPVAPTWKAGHGDTIDMALIDEAWAFVDGSLEQGVRPAMITRPEPQLWIVSAAGTPDSLYLADKIGEGREAAKRGATSGVAFFEWSADPDAPGFDPGDPAVWRRVMPALRHEGNPNGLITEESIRLEYESWALSEFMRAYLCVPTTIRAASVIKPELWSNILDRDSRPRGALVACFDVSPDRDRGAVAIVGARKDASGDPRSGVHGEVIRHDDGNDWIPAFMGSLRRDGVRRAVFDSTGPAAGLATDVRRAGMPCEPMSAVEVRDACGLFLDGVRDASSDYGLRHIGQPDLDAAINGAAKSDRSDVWRWVRRTSACDISPLVALTLAYGSYRTRPFVTLTGAPAA